MLFFFIEWEEEKRARLYGFAKPVCCLEDEVDGAADEMEEGCMGGAGGI